MIPIPDDREAVVREMREYAEGTTAGGVPTALRYWADRLEAASTPPGEPSEEALVRIARVLARQQAVPESHVDDPLRPADREIYRARALEVYAAIGRAFDEAIDSLARPGGEPSEEAVEAGVRAQLQGVYSIGSNSPPGHIERQVAIQVGRAMYAVDAVSGKEGER